MFKVMALVLSLTTFTVFSQEVSFKRGTEIATDEINGQVTVNCPNSRGRWMTYSCRNVGLVGGSYGSIVVLNGTIDADWVTLQREGDSKIKGAAFDSLSQSTGANFNLWLRSLFQSPLLLSGLNRINYKFYKNNILVRSGFFDVQVVPGDYRYCAPSTTTYYGACPVPVNACNDYFRRFNYCR